MSKLVPVIPFEIEEIWNMQCRQGWHKVNGQWLSHFQFGEKKCRHCNVFYKVTYPLNNCPECGRKLSFSSHCYEAKYKDSCLRQ